MAAFRDVDTEVESRSVPAKYGLRCTIPVQAGRRGGAGLDIVGLRSKIARLIPPYIQ
jgi:hypothetical protein